MTSTKLLLAAVACSTAALAATGAFADPTEKWCSGVNIAAFPGGPQGGVFANNVYNGFRQAELDLGPTVTYYFSNWDPNLMLQQIQQAVATGVDGIATYGFAGEPATGPIVDQAFASGIIFTTLNTSLPESQAEYAPRALAMSARRTTPRATRSRPRRSSGPASSPVTPSSSGACRARAATVASAPSASSTPSPRPA